MLSGANFRVYRLVLHEFFPLPHQGHLEIRGFPVQSRVDVLPPQPVQDENSNARGYGEARDPLSDAVSHAGIRNRFFILAHLLIDEAEFKSCWRVIGVNC